MTAVSVYAVFADAKQAELIGRTVVDERLAACANILGTVHSIYRWKGAIETAHEVAAIFKTTATAADALMRRISELHSYEVPCITVWPIAKILGSYEAFVEENVS